MNERRYAVAWWKVGGILLSLAFLIWHPVTRRVVWQILPIGTKPDDLVFVAMAIGIASLVILTVRGVVQRNIIFDLFASLTLKEKTKNVYNPDETWES